VTDVALMLHRAAANAKGSIFVLALALTSPRAIRFWSILASALVIIGAKLWLIIIYGSETPFWDQWDSEPAFLYKPYLENSLRVSDLFVPHNEHRILFTRILALTLLELNGYWDTILQMTINAAIHAASIAVLLTLLGRALQAGHVTLLAVFTALLFAIPFGWENSLSGFQSQFYLLLLFTFLCFLTFRGAAAFSARWWLGIALALACFFSLASGAFTLVSIVAPPLHASRKGGVQPEERSPTPANALDASRSRKKSRPLAE
jgi:hypothetical protein